MKNIDIVAAVLLVVGGLNWGSIALGGPDLVAALLGAGSGASRLVYGLVGLSAVWQAMQWKAIQRRWLLRPAGALSVVALALFAAAPAHAQQPGMETGMAKPTMNVVETAVAAGDFTTLATALKAADLVKTLEGPGPFTVFAPTDAAFAKLPPGTLEALLKDKAQLTKVLTYHVVPGEVRAADLKPRADRNGYVKLKTVEGAELAVQLTTTGVLVGKQKANVTSADVAASNGVIHVIDTVILPPGM
jgi:uncharacterized surface protein with fasciclin (FAS1) repeats/uncharacterized membrane protein YuzA (DUF378 family)